MKTLSRMILPAMLAALLAGFNVHAQGLGDSAPDFSRPLKPALAESDGKGGAEPAKNAAESQEELAKAAQNPIANMISVPFQNNFNFGIGPNKVTQWDLNVQPVIPISLNEDWNVVTPNNGPDWQLRVQLQLLFPE